MVGSEYPEPCHAWGGQPGCLSHNPRGWYRHPLLDSCLEET
jgi:hypothetical protein